MDNLKDTSSAILSHPTLTTLLQNPLNLALSLILSYMILPHLLPISISNLTPKIKEASLPDSHRIYSSLPLASPPSAQWRRYTPNTLAAFDGSKKQSGKPILLSINRKVFDVSSGANFYGPGGPYGNFAGRDASRGMAKQSFDEEMLTPLDKPIDKLQDLTPSEYKNMRDWEGHFVAKYPVIGELADSDEEK